LRCAAPPDLADSGKLAAALEIVTSIPKSSLSCATRAEKPEGLAQRESRKSFPGHRPTASQGLYLIVQTVVCFANSRKNGSRCFAGKEWSRSGRGVWVRPVSGGEKRALSPRQMTFWDGLQPTLLDIVQVPVESALPEGHQRENVLVSDKRSWARVGRLRWADVGKWLDTPEQLWALHGQSSGLLNNSVCAGRLVADSSLQLITVPRLLLRLIDSPRLNEPYRRVVVGEFDYHGVSYRLHVTDNQMEDQCRSRHGLVEIAQPVLCVSLGECFYGHCYKLIAAVLFEARFS
jgi:hypothetical protein